MKQPDYKKQILDLQQKFNQNELDSSDLIDLIIQARQQRDHSDEKATRSNTLYLQAELKYTEMKKSLKRVIKNY